MELPINSEAWSNSLREKETITRLKKSFGDNDENGDKIVLTQKKNKQLIKNSIETSNGKFLEKTSLVKKVTIEIGKNMVEKPSRVSSDALIAYSMPQESNINTSINGFV